MRTKIETETRHVESNGWVDTGAYHSASFAHPQPESVKGCPLGRSQESMADAIRDLVQRTNAESGTAYKVSDLETVRHNGHPVATSTEDPAPAPPARVLHLKQDPAGQWMYQTREGDRVSIPWQYGGFDRDETIRQARDRFSFDEVAPDSAPAPAAPAPAPAPNPQDAPLPPDLDGMNEDRAGWARQALEHFRNVTGSDAEDALTDLLATLRHLCDRESETYGTYEDADARAAGMYAEEITPPPASFLQSNHIPTS